MATGTKLHCSSGARHLARRQNRPLHETHQSHFIPLFSELTPTAAGTLQAPNLLWLAEPRSSLALGSRSDSFMCSYLPVSKCHSYCTVHVLKKQIRRPEEEKKTKPYRKKGYDYMG